MSSVTTTVNPSTQYLYRLRDADGVLLYVGIARDWTSRMKQHQADKPWWSEVSTVELVRMDCTRKQIEAIEKAVIKAERPVYNVTHNVPEDRTQLGARAKRTGNPIRQQRNGDSRALTWAERHEIVLKFSDWGPEWHRNAANYYQPGWVVEHPEFGEGIVIHCDDDQIHGDVRVNFWDDDLPYRCLSIHWAPLKVVAK